MRKSDLFMSGALNKNDKSVHQGRGQLDNPVVKKNSVKPTIPKDSLSCFILSLFRQCLEFLPLGEKTHDITWRIFIYTHLRTHNND